ncbi:MAG: ABC transporter ATP-binding protein [Lachnospiraceae bacterium]
MSGYAKEDMENYFFRTKQMTVGYKEKPLIREIEIGLKQGEILTLIGPNGAGKSTVLKSIAGQLKLIEGMVYLGEEELTRLKPEKKARQMAVLFTERLKAQLMTCEDVVATGRYPYTGRFGILTEEDKEKVAEAMELIQIEEIRDKRFKEVSDGQRQRVMLARAICQEPQLVVLDEPTSYLDVKHKLEFLSTLQRMKKERGLTVIMSLHELELAERVSDKILALKGEYVDRFGSPWEIFRSGYIGQLFGIATGSFDEINGSMELQAPGGEAKIFVLAGGGSGHSTFRQLQREGRAFAAGILYENDLDYPVAKALAAKVISAPSFEPVTEEIYEAAKRALAECEILICCKKNFGSLEEANRRLLREAQKRGKAIVYP